MREERRKEDCFPPSFFPWAEKIYTSVSQAEHQQNLHGHCFAPSFPCTQVVFIIDPSKEGKELWLRSNTGLDYASFSFNDKTFYVVIIQKNSKHKNLIAHTQHGLHALG